MKTFKQYILLEDKVNYKKYGSWINSKTREVLNVSDFKHADVMWDWMSDNGEGGKDALRLGSTGWAKKNGWVRVVHDGNDYSLDGTIKDIKKIWLMVARQFSKQWLSVDLDGSNQPFASDSFDMTNPKERNEWLRYMQRK